MELVAGYARIILFSVFAYFGNEAANLIMLLNSLAHCIVADVDAVNIVNFVKQLDLKLLLKVLNGVRHNFERNICD